MTMVPREMGDVDLNIKPVAVEYWASKARDSCSDLGIWIGD